MPVGAFLTTYPDTGNHCLMIASFEVIRATGELPYAVACTLRSSTSLTPVTANIAASNSLNLTEPSKFVTEAFCKNESIAAKTVAVIIDEYWPW